MNAPLPKTSAWRILSVAALLLASVACRRGGTDWRILQLYSGETTVEVLEHPTTVTMFPLGAAEGSKDAPIHAGPFPAAGPAATLDAEAASQVSRILSDPENYDWRRTKREGFRPQVGISLARGPYAIETAIDLETAQIAVHAGTQFLGVHSIDPARERLLALAKAALPDDPALRELR